MVQASKDWIVDWVHISHRLGYFKNLITSVVILLQIIWIEGGMVVLDISSTTTFISEIVWSQASEGGAAAFFFRSQGLEESIKCPAKSYELLQKINSTHCPIRTN